MLDIFEYTDKKSRFKRIIENKKKNNQSILF